MGRRTQDPPSELELAVVARDGISVAALPTSGTVTLGRGEECDVRIDSRSVSRRHAILHLGDALRIQDLGSVNGTFVRDARTLVDTSTTHPLRKLSKETLDISVGERINLGSIPIVVRRVAPALRPDGPAAGNGAVVEDPAMRALHDQAARAARSPISVLLLGETGVGKEVLARAIHDRSPRARGPYVEIHCAALPPSLLEAELFGHEKGAFTGANQARAGLLESADGGTIFLDEIGELPAAVQVKLLRVLEDHKVTRIGGRTPKKLDVRFVAATNRNLEAEVAAGHFRQDLYFRLNGVAFVIPPLRERTAEIAPLAERFLAAASQTLDRATPLRLSREALRYLESYAWPGNVRELRNAIERAAVLATGDVLAPADFPGHITRITSPAARGASPHAGASRPSGTSIAHTGGHTGSRTDGRTDDRASDRTEDDADDRIGSTPPPPHDSSERQRILDALEHCAGNQTRAAKLLGISLRTLVNRLNEHDIPRPRQRK